jgi:catechol 2,3-dioxygenase-like lactoylglutathione lyase family enzyme
MAAPLSPDPKSDTNIATQRRREGARGMRYHPRIPVRIHHVALRVADCERSAAFYSRLLGLTERRRLHDGGALRAIWLEAEGALLMLERALRGTGSSEGSGHLLAFAVDDLARWERRLAEEGVAVEDRTAHTLYVRDPDGHRVGLSTYRQGP